MTELAEITIRSLEPSDERAVLDGFNRCFGAVDADFRPRSSELWRWRFLANPAGCHVRIAVDTGGAVCAQFAGLPQPARIQGRPKLFSHIVDSFSRRGDGLSKHGAFVRTARALVGDVGGDGEGDVQLMWGLPMPSAWRIGRAQLGYKMLEPVWRLELEERNWLGAPFDGVELEAVERFPDEVDELFERCAQEHDAIVVRDRRMLDWRYVQHPEEAYHVVLARRAGMLVGYLVYRAGELEGRRVGILCDWLVPAVELDAQHALRAWLFDAARTEDALPVVAAFSPHGREWNTFQAAGYRVRPSRWFFAGRSFERERDAVWYARNLYTTLGDTDLV
ncbi:MAG: hypothetical protein GY711_01425 [bacterium]|nr:hypothetical protein [bacterium]